MNINESKIKARNEKFVSKSATRIWHEIPASSNPYIAESCYCHGYNIIELAEKRTFTDVIFLLIQGELPTDQESKFFETFFTLFVNPGPRHPATRAAMNAGVGKTNPSHILPISLSVAGGDVGGGSEVTNSMLFIRSSFREDPALLAQNLSTNINNETMRIAPGFGSIFGGIDAFRTSIAGTLLSLEGEKKYLSWSAKFADEIKYLNMGWLSTGLAAAVLLDLGFHPRAGAGIYQLACAPGLLAHGIELANQPRSAYPFLNDSHYIIETSNE